MAAPTWAPTAAQVKALVPARVNGQPFGATTRPTLAEVNLIIEQVAGEVLGELGRYMPRELEDQGRWATTLGAASAIELGFFPEQHDEGGGDLGNALYRRYQDALGRLTQAASCGPSVDSAVIVSAVVTTADAAEPPLPTL